MFRALKKFRHYMKKLEQQAGKQQTYNLKEFFLIL